METKDDLFYIEKVKAGQTSYYSYIVEKYKDIVFSIALKVLRNREDAEELAQESFIKAYNSLHTFKGKAKFSTWLYSITNNTCISYVRKRKMNFTSIYDVQIKDEADDFDKNAISEEARSVYLKKALDKLPEEDYLLVVLFYYENQSIVDICKVRKLSESNAKVKLHRARKKLYTILNSMLKEEIHIMQ